MDCNKQFIQLSAETRIALVNTDSYVLIKNMLYCTLAKLSVLFCCTSLLGIQCSTTVCFCIGAHLPCISRHAVNPLAVMAVH